MNGVCHQEGKPHQGFGFYVPSVEDLLAIARGMSSIQAVRMESQATFLNDQDTLHVLLTESGVGIEEIACTHASADNNDVICLCGCHL